MSVNEPLDPDDIGALERARRDVAFFRSLAETFDHGIVVFEDDGRVRYVSPVVEEFLGMSAEEIVGTAITDYIEEDELPFVIEALAWAIDHPTIKRQALQIRLKSRGQPRLVEAEARVLRYDPRVRGLVVFLRDVTHEATLDRILETVMRGEHIDITLEIIAGLVWQELRRGAVVISPAEGDLGLDEIRSANAPAALRSMYVDAARDGMVTPWQRAIESVEISLQTVTGLPDGLRDTVRSAGLQGCWSAPMVSSSGAVFGCLTVWVADDLPPSPGERAFLIRLARMAAFALERWESDRASAHAARHDPLTRLPNRVELAAALGHARNTTNAGTEQHAMLVVEVDGVRGINERHGHLVGDQVLVTVAERLRAVVRHDDIVARLGGTQFAVLCASVSGTTIAVDVAERILEAVCRPIGVDDLVLAVSASTGIALDGGEYRDPMTVVAEARRALARAKADGGRRWRLVSTDEPLAVQP